MKKLLIMFFAIMPFFFVKASVGAEVSDFTVTFTASFDNENIGVPMTLNKAYGTKVSFSSFIEDLTDYQFAFWIIDGVVRDDVAYDQDFYVTSNMDIHAFFTRADEFAAVFMDANKSVLATRYANDSNDYKVGDPFISEYPTKPNYVVNEENKWGEPVNTAIFENKVYVLRYLLDTTATFELTVDGIVTEHDYNDLVTVTAPTKTGEFFQYWKRNGQVVSYDETIKVSVLEDTLLESVYGATALTSSEPEIYLSEGLALRSGYKSHYAQFYLPEGYELVEFGMLTIDALYAGFETDTDLLQHDIVKRQGMSYQTSSNEYLMSFNESKSVSVRAYLVYEHNGIISTIYNNINEPMSLTYTPTFLGSPVSYVTVKDALGNPVLNYTVFLEGVSYASTINGTVVLPNGFPASRTVVVVNGNPYPVEVK